MGTPYSIIAQLNQDGSLRYIQNDQYSSFRSEAVDVIRYEESDFQDLFRESRQVGSLYALLALADEKESSPEAIFLYTNKWQVMVEGIIYDLEKRLQHDEHWFSNLLAEKFSVIGTVHDSGDISYVYTYVLRFHDIQEIIQLQEADIVPFLQQGDLKPSEDCLYQAPRIGHPKTASSLYHLLCSLGETPILYGKKLQWIFLYRKGKWEGITGHSLMPGKFALEV